MSNSQVTKVTTTTITETVETKQPHRVTKTLHELAYYPEHGPRSEDPHYKIFNKARHHMIDVLGVGCWIGGATKAQLKAGLPKDHPCYGATQLEAHHNIAEWAALSEVDFQKVAKDFPDLEITSEEDLLRVAESDGGLRCLCSKHHRSPFHGIHAVTEPIWKLQKYCLDGFSFIPDQPGDSLNADDPDEGQ